jgi:gluconate 2-dehydrogenase gamma chain
MSVQEHAYGYLTAQEARFLDAAVARLIPADGLGPGAKEAGVTIFIDRQLVSFWGTHGRNYRMGPWREGTPQQGFQSRLTPQEIYRAGIRETNLHCVARHGKVFEFLSADLQDQVLQALEDNEVPLESLPSRLFFNLLLRNTMEGFFGDPMYGGNRDKVGWKLIGFPGLPASNYAELLLKHGEAYQVEPVGILDVTQERVKVDAQGYPKHVMSKDQKHDGR